MILDRPDAAPGARYHKSARSARYNGTDRMRSLRILSAVTFMTVVMLAGLITWVSLA